MKVENLYDLSEEELYELARGNKIKGRTDMTKEELREALAKLMMDEGQTKIEAEKFDLGTPIIGMGSSNQKLPSSHTSVQTAVAASEVLKGKNSPFFDGDPLPDKYYEDILVLMPKNPQWAYAYWEITDNKYNEIKTNYGDQTLSSSKLSIRVYDVTLKEFDGLNANNYFDVELPEGVNDWFIGGLNPKASYLADIGLKTLDGQFITIVRSKAMETPSDSVSTNIDEEWMIVEEYFKKIMERSSAGRIIDGKWVGGMGASGAMLGSSEEMLALMLKKLIGQKGMKREKILANLERNMGSISVSSLGSSSLASSSLGLGSLGTGKLNIAKGDILLTEGEIERSKDFWLKVGTELILYGATEPDAKVTVMGREVKLNSDGTFSQRYALPIGHYELPVVAISADGEDRREITPIVDRTEK